jgi:hypothetical protein
MEMGGYKVEQRRLFYQGREFHFVSYEGSRANPGRGQPETPPTWFLMSGGRRLAVMPQRAGQEPEELDRCLLEWLQTVLR